MIFQLIDSYKSYFDALDIYNSRFVIPEMSDPLLIKGGQGIGKALFSIIMAVIIGCIYRERSLQVRMY